MYYIMIVGISLIEPEAMEHGDDDFGEDTFNNQIELDEKHGSIKIEMLDDDIYIYIPKEINPFQKEELLNFVKQLEVALNRTRNKG